MKKPPEKVAYLWQLGAFFSAATTAQNSPELHFRFINYFIQPSRVGSLYHTNIDFLTVTTKSDTFSVLVIKKVFFTY